MSNKNIFQYVADPNIPKSAQDLSHEFKFSGQMGNLIPVLNLDCLPGDKVHLDNEALVRMMPMVAPPMDTFNVTFHRYFVPKRLLWDHWDEYVSLTKIGSPAALPVHPFITIDPTAHPGILANYMGVPYQYDPANQTANTDINPLRWAAYQCIYNEYYRDQNLIPALDFKLVDGDNNSKLTMLMTLRKRAWNHDYFTSGLPFVQKGDPVLMPFLGATDVDVYLKPGTTNPGIHLLAASGHGAPPVPGTIEERSGPSPFAHSEHIGVADATVYDPNQTLAADTSTLQASTTINDFRRANSIQRFQERLARVGSRFTEFLKGVFNVSSRDSRLQRPEYIGGDMKRITITEVLNTSATTTEPQGNMSGHGACYISGSQSSFFCEEHGYIIIIMNVQPKGTYFQGLDKDLLKINHPTEIYVPDLANLGEQETQRQELYAYTALKVEPFNYVPRWTEHRYMPNRLAGQVADTPLLHWTAARFFSNEPNFNQTFIESTGDGSSDRIFAVTDPNEDKIICQVFNTVKMVRPIPKLGTPAI